MLDTSFDEERVNEVGDALDLLELDGPALHDLVVVELHECALRLDVGGHHRRVQVLRGRRVVIVYY